MKHAVEMGLGAMIYMPSFVKFRSGIQKLLGRGIHGHKNNKVISKANVYFFKIRTVG
jgi:hypothetical protein